MAKVFVLGGIAFRPTSNLMLDFGRPVNEPVQTEISHESLIVTYRYYYKPTLNIILNGRKSSGYYKQQGSTE